MGETRLDEDAIRLRLREIPGWELREGKLHREFNFHDFCEAFAFMTAAALAAERLDHHPEWFNVYNRVRVDLTTHSAGGVTEKDFELARVMNRRAAP